MQQLIQLMLSFMVIGIGAYGGGLVTIPLIQHEIVTKQGWVPFEEMASMLAIAQMTPGPIAVNAATFVGYRVGGILGAVVATFGVVLPSILILMFLAPSIDRLSDNVHMRKARRGLQLGVVSLIIYATWSYSSSALTGWLDLVIAGAALAFLIIFEGKAHPVFVILACGVLGFFIF